MSDNEITQFSSELSLDEADPKEVARRLIAEIDNSEQSFKEWFKRCKKIQKRYLDERASEQQLQPQRKYNILWSNTQTALPAVYSQTPKPEIERRFRDADPVGRAASQMLERCATYSLACDDFDGSMKSSTLDYLLFGRAVGWLRYKPYFKPADDETTEGAEPNDTPQEDQAEDIDAPDDLNDDEMGEDKALAYEEAPYEYIHREDFLHSVARCWSEVWWVSRKVYLTRQECIERFGEEIGKALPLDSFPDTLAENEQKSGRFNHMKKARIYELWCKSNRKIYWLCKGYSQGYLDAKDDWLGLRDFFPCPRPAYGTTGNDSLIPTPDFVEYQDQADEMDDLSQRIKMLTKGLKAAGVYDGSATQLKELLSEGQDFTLIPVENWAMFAEKGGIDGAISWWPADRVAKVLLDLFQARDACKQEIYEITGFSDIMRGASEASETATAQTIKSQYGSMRLRDKQKEVQRFARDIIRLKTEIVAEHFSPDTLVMMSNMNLPPRPTPEQQAMAQQSGQQLPPGPYLEDVIDLLRNDGLRGFRIDIETDSTILADQQQEKQLRTEFLESVGGFLQSAVPLGEQVPAMLPLLGQLLMFGIRGFGGSTRQLEQPFEDALAQMEKTASQPQPSKVDPAVQVAQINAESDQKKAAMDVQTAAQKAQIDQQTELQKHQMALQADMQKHQMSIDSNERLGQQKIAATSKPAANVNVTAQGELGDLVNSVINQSQVHQQQSEMTTQALAQAIAQLGAIAQQITLALNQPKQVVRGPDGRVSGVAPVGMQ